MDCGLDLLVEVEYPVVRARTAGDSMNRDVPLDPPRSLDVLHHIENISGGCHSLGSSNFGDCTQVCGRRRLGSVHD